MATKKLSPEFPATVKPVRNGVYRRRLLRSCGSSRVYFSMWCDGRWGMLSKSKAGAIEVGCLRSYHQSAGFVWWGLAEEPKP